MDYRVRGFTRDISGNKIFLDDKLTSIQNYIDPKTLRDYDAVDMNVYQHNLFHTKMMVKDVVLQDYLFNSDVYELAPKKRLEITNNIRREMIEIFSGVNVYSG
jgi:S-adenosylmethionine decarboxylase